MTLLLTGPIPLAVLSGLILLAAGTGNLLLLRWGIPVAGSRERFLFSTVLGLGVLSTFVFALAVLRLLTPAAIFSLLAGLAILAAMGWRFSESAACTAPDPAPTVDRTDRCFALLLWVGVAAGLCGVLTPAVGNDALSYHLAVPQHYLQHRGFYFIPGNIFSNYPMNGEMLFLIGLFLSGDMLAKGIHFATALLTLAGMGAFLRIHLPQLTLRFFTLLVFFSIPSVFVTAQMAYTDLVLTLYAFFAFYALFNWRRCNHPGWLGVCGVLTGLAMGSKYAGLLLPFLGCLGVLHVCKERKTGVLRTLGLLSAYGAVTTAVGCPFYLKNWVLTGNPFYPFFFELFGGRGWDLEQARYYDLFLQQLGMGRDFSDYLLLPWNLSFHARMHSPRFDGLLGPIFLFTLPFAAGIRKIPAPIKAGLVSCAFWFLFWAVSAQQLRYLIPIFPFLAITTGYTVQRYRKNRKVYALLLCLAAAGFCVAIVHSAGEFNKIKPLRYLSGREDRKAFLSRLIPSYGMFQFINTELPPDAKIFFIYMKNPGFLCNRAYFSDSMFESYTIQKILSRSATSHQVYTRLKADGFTHLLYDVRYVFGDRSTFSEPEKSLFHAFHAQHLRPVKTEAVYSLFRLVPDG